RRADFHFQTSPLVPFFFTDLTKPVIKSAKFNSKTKQLTLDIQRVVGATEYTVIVSEDGTAYDVFKIEADQTIVEGVQCDGCRVAVRALNEKAKGTFSDKKWITFTDYSWIPISFATFDGSTLHVKLARSADSLTIKTEHVDEIVPITGTEYLSDTAKHPLFVQAEKGPWFNVTRNAQSDAKNQPDVISCYQYGPIVYPVIRQVDSQKFTPQYEGLVVKDNAVVSKGKWYGYYGKITYVKCEKCVLYVREILPSGYSAFSPKKTIEISEDHRDTHFEVSGENLGFSLTWTARRPVLISYKNTLNNKTTVIPTGRSSGTYILQNLDACTPYVYEGRFENSMDPWQIITVVTEPEKPNVTSFTATSYMHTVLEAELATNGHCPLVFSFNVFERVRGNKDLQHMGPPVPFAVTKETGAIINPLVNGNYKVQLKYEAYNDPGCGERTIALVPMAGGDQVHSVPLIRRNVSVDLRVSVTRVEQTNGLNVTLLDLDLCRLRNYSVTLENENEKVVKYLTEGSVIISTRNPCKQCKLTVDNIGYKSEMRPVVFDKISTNSNLFEVSESDQNITMNWDIPVQSFTNYQVIVSHPNTVVDVNSSRAIELPSFQINSSTGSHSFEPRECGTYQVTLRHPNGMMENHSVTIQRRNDRVVVNPTLEADGNKLKLDLSRNDKCLGSQYYVNLVKSNGDKLNQWVNKDDAELSGVTCLPCNLTISIPNATVAVSHSEPVYVWFGPIRVSAEHKSDKTLIGWEIPRKSTNQYTIESDLDGKESETIDLKDNIAKHNGTHERTVSGCGTMMVRLKKGENLVANTSLVIKPRSEFDHLKCAKVDALSEINLSV
ncbi:hypothetical protein D915_010097, partial [Fasciola hepatica]